MGENNNSVRPGRPTVKSLAQLTTKKIVSSLSSVGIRDSLVC